ncbi:MAG TPA: tetratricopeptide repeat protein [Thermoanaerobaculia bacterium]|nr:tetratricopeptide repeat protein [Thermoanaerobaculia bacterium]
MARKITRKDLKRNELVETMGKTVDYVNLHRRGVTEGLLAAAIVLALAAGFLLLRIYRQNQAGNELSAGLAALDVPIAGTPAAAGAQKTFASDAEREKQAVGHLQKAASHDSTPAGRAAALVLAARAPSASSGDTFTKTAREGKAEVAASAELDAARYLASQGKKTEAIERLKRAIESPASPAPKDALLFALGEIYEEAGSASDAKATFQRLVSDYPNSPYRNDARQKIPGS